jgi:hypothetical protein
MLLKSIFKYNLQGCGLTSTDSEHEILVVSFEYGNVSSGYIKTGNVLTKWAIQVLKQTSSIELAEGKLRLTTIMGAAMFDRDHHSDSA